MMCSNFLCKILLNTSLKLRLSIKTMHFDFIFHTVLTQNVSSFKAVKVIFFWLLFNFIKENYISLLSQQSALQLTSLTTL